MDSRSFTVDVSVGALDVQEWAADGPEQGTVLALHGFPESPWEWEAVARILTPQGYRVIAPHSGDMRPGPDRRTSAHMRSRS